MVHALHSISHTERLHPIRRLPGLLPPRLIAGARWLVTMLLVWLVIRCIDFGTLLDLIARAALPGLGFAGVVAAVQFIVLAWRWQLVMRILGGIPVGLGPLSVFLGHSFLVGQVLPSSVGGDVARTVMLARLTGTAIAARSVVCDRVLGFASLALLAVLTLPMMAARMGGLTPFPTAAIAVLGTMVAALLVLASASLIHGVPWLRAPVATVVSDLRLTLCSGKVSLVTVTLGVGSSILSVLLIYIFGLAIGANLRLFDCLVLAPPALLVSVLPISLAGWGVREGALVAAFNLAHADPTAVAAISVMLGLTTPLAGVAVAAMSLFTGALNVPKSGSRGGG
jgi:glycosyltransferase 2 family protein